MIKDAAKTPLIILSVGVALIAITVMAIPLGYTYPPILPVVWHRILHLLGAALLVSTGPIGAVWLSRAVRSRNHATIQHAIVSSQWQESLITLPAVWLIFYNGFVLAKPIENVYKLPWISASFVLLVLSGVCWLFIIRLYGRLLDLSDREPDGSAFQRAAGFLGAWSILAQLFILSAFIFMVLRPEWPKLLT